MKKNYLLLSFVVTSCFVCSCGSNEESFSIPLFEIENGDTVSYDYYLKPGDLAGLIEEGVTVNENFGMVVSEKVKNGWNNAVELDLSIIRAHITSATKTDSEVIPFDKEKVIDGSKDDLYYGYCYIQPFGKFLIIGYFDKEEPFHATYTFLIKEEALGEIKDLRVNNEKYKDFTDDQLLMMYGLAFIKKTGYYYGARSFKSKSGIYTRIMLMCKGQ